MCIEDKNLLYFKSIIKLFKSFDTNEIHDGENVILVWGNTNVGKSTIINLLLGTDLEKMIDGKIYLKSNDEVTEINKGFKRKTLFTKICKSKENRYIFLDTPGYDKKKSDIYTTIELLSIKSILKKVNIMAVLVVFDMRFNDYIDFEQTILNVENIFNVIPEESLFFIFNKEYEGTDENDIIKRLIYFKNKIKKSIYDKNIKDKQRVNNVKILNMTEFIINNKENIGILFNGGENIEHFNNKVKSFLNKKIESERTIGIEKFNIEYDKRIRIFYKNILKLIMNNIIKMDKIININNILNIYKNIYNNLSRRVLNGDINEMKEYVEIIKEEFNNVFLFLDDKLDNLKSELKSNYDNDDEILYEEIRMYRDKFPLFGDMFDEYKQLYYVKYEHQFSRFYEIPYGGFFLKKKYNKLDNRKLENYKCIYDGKGKEKGYGLLKFYGKRNKYHENKIIIKKYEENIKSIESFKTITHNHINIYIAEGFSNVLENMKENINFLENELKIEKMKFNNNKTIDFILNIFEKIDLDKKWGYIIDIFINNTKKCMELENE